MSNHARLLKVQGANPDHIEFIKNLRKLLCLDLDDVITQIDKAVFHLGNIGKNEDYYNIVIIRAILEVMKHEQKQSHTTCQDLKEKMRA